MSLPRRDFVEDPDKWHESVVNRLSAEMRDFRRKSQELMSNPLESPGHHGRCHRVRSGTDTLSDGTVVHSTVFDVHGYTDDEVKVELVGDRRVLVKGEAVIEDPDSGISKKMHFEEDLTLPSTADASKLKSVLKDGRLTVTAPLAPPRYSHVSMDIEPPRSPRMGSPRSESPRSHTKNTSIFHLDVMLDKAFKAEDVKVRTRDGKLTVQASLNTPERVREFKEQFTLPYNVDCSRMTAKLRSDGKVIVEAPFKIESTFDFQNLTISHE